MYACSRPFDYMIAYLLRTVLYLHHSNVLQTPCIRPVEDPLSSSTFDSNTHPSGPSDSLQQSSICLDTSVVPSSCGFSCLFRVHLPFSTQYLCCSYLRSSETPVLALHAIPTLLFLEALFSDLLLQTQTCVFIDLTSTSVSVLAHRIDGRR